jgi:hypothetical protein
MQVGSGDGFAAARIEANRPSRHLDGPGRSTLAGPHWLKGRDGEGRLQHVALDRRPMPLRVRIAGLLIAAGSFGPAAADQPDTVKAVTPGGPRCADQMSRLGRDQLLPDLSPHQPAIPDRGRRHDHHLVRQSPQRIWVLRRPDRPQRPALRDLQQSRRRSPPG